jgi:hypothetical protein
LRTLGPDAALQWQVSRWGTLQCNGWYEIVEDGNVPARVIPNVNMSVSWNF